MGGEREAFGHGHLASFKAEIKREIPYSKNWQQNF